jgi:ubiquinone/menaquinone biosynthesis C-methylase UbiE
MAVFDSVAARYDAFFRTPLGRYVWQAERAALRRALAPRPGEAIVDLGCGTGLFSHWLAREGLRVTGVDLSEGMLRRASRRLARSPNARCLKGDIVATPFPAAAFDAALLQTVLEFVDDPAAALKEAGRIVRPGGRIVVGLIARDGPWADAYLREAAEVPTSVYRHARFFSWQDLRSLLPEETLTMFPALFVAPEDVTDAFAARRAEEAARRAGTPSGAGFLAIRWERG